MMELMMLAVLLCLTCRDIRTRTIPVWILVPAASAVVFSYIYHGVEKWQSPVAGAAIGVVFLLISKITGEGIGYGDSLTILVLGLAFGWRRLVEILCTAFCILFISAIVLCCRKRVTRKDSLPFLPYLTGGYVIWLVVSRLS